MRKLSIRFILPFVISAMLLTGGWLARPLLIATEFAAFTIQIKKIGRTSASITYSGGKYALKLEYEIIKDGFKAGIAIPFEKFQQIAAYLYRHMHNGEEPPRAFDETKGIFIILLHKDTSTIYVAENDNLCVANVAEAQLIRVSMATRTITIPVSGERTDIVFGASDAECIAITDEIENRKKVPKPDSRTQVASPANDFPPIPDSPQPSAQEPIHAPRPATNFDECNHPENYPGQTTVSCVSP